MASLWDIKWTWPSICTLYCKKQSP